MRMSDYLIINDNPKDVNHGTVIVSGDTPLDAINKFDGLLREKGMCVNHAIVSHPEPKWIITTESIKLDKYYKQESYEIYPKEVEE